MKILLVDDNPELAEATRDVLEALGHSVVALSSAEAALDHRAGEDFEVLLTDYLLPGMTGLELIRRWQEPALKTILITSHAHDGEVVAGAEGLGVPILAKPFSVQELEAALEVASCPQGSSGGRNVQRAGPRPERPASATQWVESSTRGAVAEVAPGPETRVLWRKGSVLVWVGLRVLTLAMALVLVAGLADLMGVREPGVPLPPTVDLVRGALLEVQAPVGPLVDFPRELVWQRVEGAWRFVVWLEAVDGRVLFQGQAADTRLVLPQEVIAGLQPGVAYHWWVEALNEQGGRLARSEKIRFRVIQTLEPAAVDATTR